MSLKTRILGLPFSVNHMIAGLCLLKWYNMSDKWAVKSISITARSRADTQLKWILFSPYLSFPISLHTTSHGFSQHSYWCIFFLQMFSVCETWSIQKKETCFNWKLTTDNVNIYQPQTCKIYQLNCSETWTQKHTHNRCAHDTVLTWMPCSTVTTAHSELECLHRQYLASTTVCESHIIPELDLSMLLIRVLMQWLCHDDSTINTGNWHVYCHYYYYYNTGSTVDSPVLKSGETILIFSNAVFKWTKSSRLLKQTPETGKFAFYSQIKQLLTLEYSANSHCSK